MNTILQQRIKEAAKEERERCREDNNEIWRGNPTYDDVEASFIKGATFALQNQWISVEEALPKEYEQVIAMSEFVDIERMEYHNKAFYRLKGSIIKDGVKITHWMEIP